MLFCLSLGSSPSKLWCDSSILQVVGLHGYPGKNGKTCWRPRFAANGVHALPSKRGGLLL